jgi:hypothetical protein
VNRITDGGIVFVGCVGQGLPSIFVRALFWSSVKGLLLTFCVGILIRFLRNPARDPVPFFVGVGAASVLGSSIYKALQSSSIAYFRRNSPFGYLGYTLGAQCGLVLLGLVCAIQARTDHRSRRRRRKKT